MPPPADDEQLAAAIGPKADWYLERWRRMDARNGTTSWSWAACFANVFWLAYRKMWVPMILLLVAIMVLAVLGSASPAMAKATLLLNLGLSFLTGYFGVHWHRKQTERLVAQTAGMERAAALDQLRSRGGVSQTALFVLIGLAALLTLLAVVGAAMQARQRLQQQNMTIAPIPGGTTDSKPPADPNAEPETEIPVDEQPSPPQDGEAQAPPPAEQQGY
jgi:hypothetical protein